MKNAICFLIICLALSTLKAQEVKIDANGKVAIGKVTPPSYPLDIDDKDNTGRTINVAGKGTGISVLTNGNGESMSTFGINAGAFGGTGTNTGILGSVSDLTSGMLGYGVFGLNTNFSNLGTGYGVYGKSTGSLTNYGIYGEASGGNTNWAGYFQGNSHFTDRLSVGTLLSDYPIMVKMSQNLFNASLIYAEVEGTESVDDIAIKGLSTPADNYGIGGQFEGGKIGVEGISNSTSDKIYTGVFGKANGGTGTNYGLRGLANGGGTNLAVYGEASGGLNNWAGYFKGDVVMENNLSIGTTNNDFPLHVSLHQDSFSSFQLAHFEVSNLTNISKIAVRGVSRNNMRQGIGGSFEGGYLGAEGIINTTNFSGSYNGFARNAGLEGRSSGNANTNNTGVYGESFYGQTNFGLSGSASGPYTNTGVAGATSSFWTGLRGIQSVAIAGNAGGSATNYGGKFQSSDVSADVNYGVYSKATGAANNWAGYFEGKAYFSDSVGIGTTSPGVKFTVDGGSDASLAGGGYIMTNSLGATNVVIDNNEIMARNNGVAAPLWINNEGGNVGLNLNSSNAPKSNLHLKHRYSFSDSVGIRIESTFDNTYVTLSSLGDNSLFLFNSASPNFPVGAFDEDGTYFQLSDKNQKSNIEILGKTLHKIRSLKAKKYHYVSNKVGDKKSIGFLAQNVELIFPELVLRNEKSNSYHLNYSGFGVIAIQGIQELDEENQKLKAEISKLHEENNDLVKRIERLEKLFTGQVSKNR